MPSPLATARFQRIRAAYDLLSDERKRKESNFPGRVEEFGRSLGRFEDLQTPLAGVLLSLMEFRGKDRIFGLPEFLVAGSGRLQHLCALQALRRLARPAAAGRWPGAAPKEGAGFSRFMVSSV